MNRKALRVRGKEPNPWFLALFSTQQQCQNKAAKEEEMKKGLADILTLVFALALVGITAAACAGSPEAANREPPQPTAVPPPAQPTTTAEAVEWVETVWVVDISNCALPEGRWNRHLYLAEKPRFTSDGATFTLELPEHYVAKLWPPSDLDVVERRFPPIITGGSGVYCNFQAWPENHRLRLQ